MKDQIAPSNPKNGPVYCPEEKKTLSSIDKETIRYFLKHDYLLERLDYKKKLLSWILLNFMTRPDVYSPNAIIEMAYVENNNPENATYLSGNFKWVAQQLIGSTKSKDWSSFFEVFNRINPKQIIVTKSFEEYVNKLKSSVKYKDIHPFYRRGIDIVRKDDILNRKLLLTSFSEIYRSQKTVPNTIKKSFSDVLCNNKNQQYIASQNTSQLFYKETENFNAIILFHSNINLGNENIFLGERLEEFIPRLCYLKKNNTTFFLSSIKGRESSQVKNQFIERVSKSNATINETLDLLSKGRWTYFKNPKRYILETKKIDKKTMNDQFLPTRLPLFHLNSIGEINFIYNGQLYKGPILDERSPLEISCHIKSK